MDAEVCFEEGYPVRRATSDCVILEDDRVLENLLRAEDRGHHSLNYFHRQREICPSMRKIVTSWMLEVCEEQQREDEVFPLSVNYLDRLLAVTPIKKTRLQLAATACLFIASKMKETAPLDGTKLVMYTDYSITLEELLDMELTVLTALRWDTSALTPHDFLHLLLVRLPIDEHHHRTVMRHASTFIAMCTIDLEMATLPPSMIAASILVASIKGLVNWSSSQHEQLINHLAHIACIDADFIKSSVKQIELLLSNNFTQPDDASDDVTNQPSMTSSSSASQSSANQKPLDTSLPTTPTDIREITVVT